MKINIGDYFIETDERQFIVKAKKIVEESRLAKKENIGKEYWQPIAYCTTFNSALKFVSQQALRSNDDISVVIDKLTQIERDIKAIDEYIKENENYKERYEELNRYIELNYESEGV
ncbi:hypothetical protein [Clostridium tertium]